VVISSDAEDASVRFPVATKPGDVEGWAAYAAGVFWALTDAGHVLPGFDLDLTSDVPRGAGLSSSAALECAVAVAVRDLADLNIDDIALALLAQRAENEYVGVPTGSMDQLASICGRTGHAVLIDTNMPRVTAVPADWESGGVRLLVIDTRANHAHGDGEYGRRRSECEAAAKAIGLDRLTSARESDLARIDDPLLLRRARHVVSETARVGAAVAALDSSDWSLLGDLFIASHASMRDDFEISCAELDAAVTAAVDAGALGARMTGGGFGGSGIALVPQKRADAVTSRCREVFVDCGWKEPHIFAVTATRGAGRVA
jgi:galactokinase